MNTDELKRFVALEERRRKLEAEIDTVKAEAAELEELLLPQFEQSGMERVAIDGRTVYVERKLWAKAKDGDKASVCKALKRCRLGTTWRRRSTPTASAPTCGNWTARGVPCRPACARS